MFVNFNATFFDTCDHIATRSDRLELDLEAYFRSRGIPPVICEHLQFQGSDIVLLATINLSATFTDGQTFLFVPFDVSL